MDTIQIQNIKKIHRVLAILLCFIMLFPLCDSAFNSFVGALENTRQVETRDEIKARLMRQIRHEEWDPYSEDMTVEEFFALMELFDEGKLPLNQASTYSSINGLAADEASYIPREKFLFAGLSKYERHAGSEDNDSPEEYDNTIDQEPIEGAAEGEPQFRYPKGLDPYGAGYKRPPITWKGIEITDKKTKRVVLVSEGVNDNNVSVAGDVIQGLFARYTGYYVKQVTIAGANINILGMIEVNGRFVYYYLSAEGQSTQVSTTTLPDEAKFIIEYVPVEHTVGYVVKMDGDDAPITNQKPENVVFYGSNSPTTLSWVDSIFSTTRPNRTTDGAYAFDVFVPYGYELRILISIDMTIDIPYQSKTNYAESFRVEIDHTGTKKAVHDAWLKAYSDYLNKEGFITGDISDYITEETDENGNITLTWSSDGEDKRAHDSILARMSERINDFVTHNNGYPLGTYPDYTVKGEGGFKILPSASSPTEHTMNDTFYNHLVKADRTVTAVLKKQAAPTFDVSQILQQSNGAADRGSSATETFAFNSLKHYDDDYAYHVKNGDTVNRGDDPLKHGSVYPNIQSEGDFWGWNKEGDSFSGKAQNMVYDAATGTYSYTWFFQTNSGESYYLDVFEVNGIGITIPYFPKYNWQNSYKINGVAEKADAKHPYYTETTLADGATLRLEFLLGWNSQRHYRVTVTGARANVVVTGLNLMQYNSGAPEFSTYNLTGVYSDKGGYRQTAPAIEYYDKSSGWARKAQANVVIQQNNEGIDYDNGDTKMHGANIRFKIADGYGNPYYMFTNRWGDPIGDQASVTLDEEWNITSYNSMKDLSDVPEGEQLSSRYIYDGGDGYYYIRVTTQETYRFALLTIVARNVKYTVRYTPEYTDDGETWNGFIIDPVSGEAIKLTKEYDLENILDLDFDSMPSYKHDPEICALWGMAKDETGTVPEIYSSILHQYDDNEGPFYDLIFNTAATIANNTYGTIIPRDKNKNYTFVDWIVVGKDFTPVKDASGNYIQFRSGVIDFTQYAHYAVKHTAFGSADTDIHVLRLMPVWRPINNPFTYNVVLNWVDNLGNIHAKNFSDYWDEVVTEKTEDGQVYVYLNKRAKPLHDWIANHPTYTFWDDVNNAITEDEIIAALVAYLDGGAAHKNYANILAALKQEKGFERKGSDIYVVTEDGGTISIWLYETKGGLIFHKDVLEDPFIPDDEFYFTVTGTKVDDDGYASPLEGTYQAYPQYVYDEDGNLRERTEADAWNVAFKNGEIASINGNEDVTYFTLKSGDGVALYVPGGQYSIVELGSKSGGLYKVKVEYMDESGVYNPDDEGWSIPSGDMWLEGTNRKLADLPPAKARVQATVNFEDGEHNVVQVLTFTNQTSSLSIGVDLDGVPADLLEEYRALDFSFTVKLTLPEDYKPLYDEDAKVYYFNMNIYHKEVVGKRITIVGESKRILLTQDGTENVWDGTIELKAGYWAVIVMSVADDVINYRVDELDALTHVFDEAGNPKSMSKDYNLHPDWKTPQEGIAVAGNRSEAKVINWYDVPFGYFVITEKDGEDNESFLYRITNKKTEESLIVSVKGGGRTYVYASLGEYFIVEISDWSWRYAEGVCVEPDTGKNSCTVKITVDNEEQEDAVHADFTHKRNDKVWLGGENSKDNRFAGSSTNDEEQGADSRKTEYALPTVAYDAGRKEHEGGDDQ